MSECNSTTFHIEGSLLNKTEREALKQYMEGDYESFEIPRGQRDGIFRIEVPPFSEAEEIKKLIMAVVPEELKSCHLLLQRRNKFVRFVPTLVHEKKSNEKVTIVGDLLDISTGLSNVKYYLRIALDNLKNMDRENRVANVAAIILHELAEKDYFLHSPKGTINNQENLGTKANSYNENEAVANRRTVRALKSRYPRIGFPGIEYPEDQA